MLGQDSGMSAIAAQEADARKGAGAHHALPSVTARLSPQEKARFTALAVASGISESALACNAIRILLNSDAVSTAIAAPLPRVAATDRITVRLRPGDGDAIARRAANRGMKAATYVSALVRAHIATDPPLATEELLSLKKAVALLAGLGRPLVQALRTASPEAAREELRRTRAAVAALEQRMAEFVEAALKSWESRSA